VGFINTILMGGTDDGDNSDGSGDDVNCGEGNVGVEGGDDVGGGEGGENADGGEELKMLTQPTTSWIPFFKLKRRKEGRMDIS
jgi:hypothetical protein